MDYFKLKHRITLRKPLQTSINTMGETTPVYENWKVVWANVEPLTGREYQESQKLQAETTYRITIRYLAVLNANMRIIFKGRTFYILSILNVGELMREMQIIALENGNGA